MSLPEELRGVIAGEVDDSKSTLDAFSRDASLFKVMPAVVAAPKDTADVEKLVQFVSGKKAENPSAHLSLTARSAGTDMSGGPLNDSIVLDMTRHFNRTLEVGEGYAVVEPGVYFRDFDKLTKAKGYELPSYTASRELCSVGGMAANDSGGEKNLKYGKTSRYIEELEVVLADGRAHVLKNYSGEELQQKLALDDFEGEVYRKMSKLVADNRETIERARPIVSKNSSGYALWDLGDGVSSLNLARLMSGAQGTLGLITKIRYGLVKPHAYSAMTVLFVKDLAELGKLVPEILAYEPDSFESYDDNTFKLAVKYFPEFAAQMKTGIVGLGIAFLPEVWMLLSGGIPKLVLMVEFRSDSQADALAKAEKLAQEVGEKNPHVGVRVAKSEQEARKYWTIRRESFNLLRKKIRGLRTAPFIDDFVVPPAKLPEFLPKLQATVAPYKLIETVAGHVGDGNFHIIPLIDPKRPDMPEVIDKLSHQVYDLVLSYHGSITGEHNDGLIRTPYIEKMFGPEMEVLFKEVKRIFDPYNIFNPGKKVGTTFQYAKQHLDLVAK